MPSLRFDFTELVGGYDATIAVVAMPRDRVAAVLPRGIELADQPLAPAGSHPVFFGFGRQSGVELVGALRHIPGFPLDYLEVIAAVPFVRRAGARSGGAFMHLANLYLDDPMAVLGGVTLWGFPKKLARASARGGLITFASLLRGEPLFAARTEGAGELRAVNEVPAFAPVTALLAQPLLQRTPAGVMVASDFDWQLDRAEIAPCRAELTVREALLPGLAGKWEAGAFRIRNRWRLSIPYPVSEARFASAAP